MKNKYIGTSIYAVYGDDFIEPITKEHAKIIEKKDGYYLAKNDREETFAAMYLDEAFNNLDFEADIGTDYREFTDEKDADKYFEYLKKQANGEKGAMDYDNRIYKSN